LDFTEELEQIRKSWNSVYNKLDEKVALLYGLTEEEIQLILNNL